MNSAENEQNAYHIDGDEDDENTSGNKDKLMAALSSDPDTVIDFMKQLSTNLYTAIDKQMQSNSLRSRYSIYNDKEMTSQRYKLYEDHCRVGDKDFRQGRLLLQEILQDGDCAFQVKQPDKFSFRYVQQLISIMQGNLLQNKIYRK